MSIDHNYILKKFISRYGYLKKYGLRINGLANLMDDVDVIAVTTPFLFDNRLIPEEFMGLTVRCGVSDLPEEFSRIAKYGDYIWAYQRFEEYVDNHGDHIRNKLGKPEMTREEMLDALCFGDFKAHKERCMKWKSDGSIS